MKNIQHISNNDVLPAPPGVPHEECTPLFITRTDFGDEGRPEPGLVTFWQPDQEEIASILAGKPIMLFVWGHTHPPLGLSVESRHAPIVKG